MAKDKIFVAEVMITLNANNKFTLFQRKRCFCLSESGLDNG